MVDKDTTTVGIMEIEVLINQALNFTRISSELSKLLSEKGYEGMCIKARTDKDVINYIKKYGENNNYPDINYEVEKVNKTRPWIIRRGGNYEYVQYLDELKLVNEELSYYE